LYRLKDIVQYVSLFTLGHSTTLLLGVFGHVRANPYLIDAVIALSVVYKGFDNMGGFQRFLGFEPNTKLAVLIFGLFHGFGLATKLQELVLSQSGLVTNIISFNVGVEIGQVAREELHERHNEAEAVCRHGHGCQHIFGLRPGRGTPRHQFVRHDQNDHPQRSDHQV